MGDVSVFRLFAGHGVSLALLLRTRYSTERSVKLIHIFAAFDPWIARFFVLQDNIPAIRGRAMHVDPDLTSRPGGSYRSDEKWALR